MFEVVTAATDLSLLSLAELRAATGSDRSEDEATKALGKYISATLVAACRITTDGAMPATLRLESLRDTFRSGDGRTRHAHVGGRARSLELSRKPVIEITSVIENDAVLDPTEFEVQKSSGLLKRLYDDRECGWPHGKIVVEYLAGWDVVPDNLKFAALRFAQLIAQQAGRDPLLKSENTPGVLAREWWVEPSREVGVPPEVMDMLNSGGFVNVWAG